MAWIKQGIEDEKIRLYTDWYEQWLTSEDRKKLLLEKGLYGLKGEDRSRRDQARKALLVQQHGEFFSQVALIMYSYDVLDFGSVEEFQYIDEAMMILPQTPGGRI